MELKLRDSDLADHRKKENKEKNDASDAPPAVSETFGMQEATRALRNKYKLRDSDYRELLKLLRSGQVDAGFHVAGSPTIWVPVGQPYWLSLAENRFAPKKDNSVLRTHRVKLRDFRDQFIEACLAPQGAPSQLPITQVKEILNDLFHQENLYFDVAIARSSWDRYALANNIGEAPSGHSSPGSGRHELPSWKVLLPAFAAYLAVEARRNPNLGKTSDATRLTKDLLEYAKSQHPGQSFPSGIDVEVRRFLSLIEGYRHP